MRRLLKDGFHPIVFCRFIPTAGYVAAHLRDRLPKTLVEVVTGELAPEERAQRVRALAEAAGSTAKVLVATDCLSEGVNLQDDFQAVVHYDLAWNPTRHEQREGRVDRFGQPREIVRAVTLYGAPTTASTASSWTCSSASMTRSAVTSASACRYLPPATRCSARSWRA